MNDTWKLILRLICELLQEILLWWWQTSTENFGQSDLEKKNPKTLCVLRRLKHHRLFPAFSSWPLNSGLIIRGNRAHLRVEPQLADAAGDVLPLCGGREAEGVVEDGLLHRVHLEGGGRRTERPINTAPTLTCDRPICFHFIRARHDQLISLFAHAGHTSTLRQHVCQGAVSTRRRQWVVLAPMRRPSKRMSFGYATWKITNVLVKNCQLY